MDNSTAGSSFNLVSMFNDFLSWIFGPKVALGIIVLFMVGATILKYFEPALKLYDRCLMPFGRLRTRSKVWRDVLKLMSPYISNLPNNPKPGTLYLWTASETDASGVEVRDYNDQLSGSNRLKNICDIQEYKLVPLFVIPRAKGNECEVLLKLNTDGWGWVLPSVKLKEVEQFNANDILNKAISSKPNGFLGVSIDGAAVLGGVISLKRSADKGNYVCYIFPFVVVKASINVDAEEPFEIGTRKYMYYSKKQLKSCLNRGSGEPNADIYYAIEHIINPWDGILKVYTATTANPV
ncbi:MAG: hypothetical protein RDU24_10560 [Humidesulfovibrio sp.]|uniref:hypothetical protein n=1 Tax=Humidesulfovibrio sp. TaxID=2910988 RepID=UPI0027F04156|nr:hypothetical protein [Humidesulfovibrio sp.]MDQ7835810.1 hypothetical protein [Humidesulfovibrio sp.]